MEGLLRQITDQLPILFLYILHFLKKHFGDDGVQTIEDLLQRRQVIIVDLPELVSEPREILPIKLYTSVDPELSAIFILG